MNASYHPAGIAIAASLSESPVLTDILLTETFSFSTGKWVCDPCEKVINELAPWEFQKRYRAEMALSADNPSVHTVMHPLVRFARASAQESTKPDANDASTNTDSTKTEESSPMGQWELLEKRIQELVTARLDAVNSHVDKRLDDVDSRLGGGGDAADDWAW